MPRSPRITIPDVPYHITQRGNHKQDVFFSPDDRVSYLEWLQHYSSLYKLGIIAYCLMTNHVHIVGIPRNEESISSIMQFVNMRYTQLINRNMGFDGHLWHGRYFSTALDETYLWHAIRYVEQNPVRAGMVEFAEQYQWSSASYHCGIGMNNLLYSDEALKSFFEDWIQTLRSVPDQKITDTIRIRTQKGFPCGDSDFDRRVLDKRGKD